MEDIFVVQGDLFPTLVRNAGGFAYSGISPSRQPGAFRMNAVVTQSAATQNTVDLAAVKRAQQATWASGDFAVVGTTLQIVGEQLAEAVDIRAGEEVLD